MNSFLNVTKCHDILMIALLLQNRIYNKIIKTGKTNTLYSIGYLKKLNSFMNLITLYIYIK